MIYLQYTALHEIYHRVPDLRKEEPLPVFSPAVEEAWTGATTSAAALAAMEASVQPERLQDASDENDAKGTPSLAKQACVALWDFGHHCRIYVRQRSFLPGLALAMLYLTVLSFHMVMLSYLLVRTCVAALRLELLARWHPQGCSHHRQCRYTHVRKQMRGLKPVYIALGQGLSSALGVLGTVTYEFLAARIGMVRAWMMSGYASRCGRFPLLFLGLLGPYTSAFFP